MRTLDASARVYQDIDFDVLAYQNDVAVDERGRRMRWIVRDGRDEVVRFEATVDSPLRYGHGRGYVGAYTYSGSWSGGPIAGSGYMEWVDCRPGSESSERRTTK